MRSKDLIYEDALDLGPMSPENLDPVRQIFARLGKEYKEPYKTTVQQLGQSIKSLEQGNHTGIYFIYGRDANSNDLAYFYIGLASRRDAGSSQTILQRFETHYYKLTVNLPVLWGGAPDQVKVEPKWQFPRQWRKGMSQQFLGGQEIPQYYQQAGSTKVNKQGRVRKLVTSANLDFVPEFTRDPLALPMLIWDLDDFNHQEIEFIETSMIRAYRPLFNTITGKYDQDPQLPQAPTRSTVLSQPAIQKNIKRAVASKKSEKPASIDPFAEWKGLLSQTNIKGGQIVNALITLGVDKVTAQGTVAGLRNKSKEDIITSLGQAGLDITDPQTVAQIRNQPID